MTEIEQLQQAMVTLEGQRANLGNSVVDAALASMREKLATLQANTQSSDQQRKQVTVLFADISGFTAMSEGLDAEDISNFINALWERLDAAILAHGGSIDKHIGDEVMALWGVQRVREDDPEQAIRAALTLQAEVRTYAASSSRAIQMRIGINTGIALLGKVGSTAEFTALGDTVNMASRLQRAAPAGGILISRDTYRHVRGLFDVQPQTPLAIRGKAEPILTYTVERARPPTFRPGTRGVEGVEVRMVGRAAELMQLQDAFDTAIRTSETGMMTIVGDPGVGKSRLLDEFTTWVEAEPEPVCLFKARAVPHTAGTPYMLLHNLFANRFNILENDPLALVRRKLEDGLAEYLGQQGPMKCDFIGALIGYDFADSPHLLGVRGNAAQLRNQALYYLTQFLTAVAQRYATVILLEDIHWADGPSLEVIRQIVHDIPHARLLLICAGRPALFEKHPAWGSDLPSHTRLNMKPLTPEESRQLVRELLKKVQVLPDELRELIVSQAEGNPFYVEELIKVLLDDLVIVEDANAGVWHIDAARLRGLRVPPTLVAVLQARLDSLTPVERVTVQQAAVVGRTFWDAILQVLQDASDSPLPTLDTLCRREIINPHAPATFAGISEYQFKHALLRDVAYESVLKRIRQVYHGKVAEWLVAETRSSGRSDEFAAVIAEHYALAGKVEHAVDYLLQAAARALAVSAYSEAQTLLERGLALLGDTPASADHLRMHLHRLLGDAHQRRGNFAPAQVHYEQSLSLARQLADASTISWVFLGLGDMTLAQGNATVARQQFLDALAHGMDNRENRAKAMHGLGLVAEYEGDYASATDHYQQSLAIHRESDNRFGIAQGLNDLCVVAFAQRDYATAVDYCQKSLAIKHEIGDRAGISVCLNNLGDIAHRQGDYHSAEECFLQSLAIDREIGNRRGQVIALGNLVEVYLSHASHARPGAAAQAVREGLRLSREMAAEPLTLYLVGQAALWRLYTGQPVQAAMWLGLVTHHPLTDPADRDGFEQVRARLEAAAPADEIAAAWTRGQGLDLNAVVAHILSLE